MGSGMHESMNFKLGCNCFWIIDDIWRMQIEVANILTKPIKDWLFKNVSDPIHSQYANPISPFSIFIIRPTMKIQSLEFPGSSLNGDKN